METRSEPDNSLPLGGLLVLEISATPGASFAASLMADFGATVVVCEVPPAGTALRRLRSDAVGAIWWSAIARNKLSLALDPTVPGSAEVIDRLLSCATLVITDQVHSRWQHDPWLKRIADLDGPPMVAEVFPTGADLPHLWNGSVAPELTGAATGMMSLTGWSSGPPVLPEFPLAEYLGGALAATGALAKLHCASTGGARSLRLPVALHEAVQRMIEWQVPVASLFGRAEPRNGNSFPMNAGVSNMHRTRDARYVAISAANQAVAFRLLRMIGGTELAQDPRFDSPATRFRNMPALYAILDDWIGARSLAQVEALAQENDVAIGPIYEVDDIAANEHVLFRKNLTSLCLSDNETVTVPAAVPAMCGSRATLTHAGPAVGAHSADVLALAGFTEEQIAQLLGAGAAWSRTPAPKIDRHLNSQRILEIARDPAAAGEAELPLRGVTVVELGTIIAGPFAGCLLADLGATVIKIEEPKAGDGLRQMGMRKHGVPIWWGIAARGKKCISLNLKDPRGRELFESFIGKADVLIENMRPDVLRRLGLAPNRLHTLNPALIILSITGFGQDGPYSKRAGFGKIAEGLSGIVPLTGSPEGAPLFVGFSLADTSSGLFGAFAVNVALLARAHHGVKNCHIDLALYEPLLRMLECQFALHQSPSVPQPARQGSNDPYAWGVRAADGAHCLTLQCRDERWIQIVGEASVLDRLRDVLELPPCSQTGQRLSSIQAHGSDWVIRRAQEAGTRAALVHDGLSIQDDPYFRARGDVLEAFHETLGNFRVPGYFPKVRPPTAPEQNFNFAEIGADNEEVFTGYLGLTGEEVASLRERGVV